MICNIAGWEINTEDICDICFEYISVPPRPPNKIVKKALKVHYWENRNLLTVHLTNPSSINHLLNCMKEL